MAKDLYVVQRVCRPLRQSAVNQPTAAGQGYSMESSWYEKEKMWAYKQSSKMAANAVLQPTLH